MICQREIKWGFKTTVHTLCLRISVSSSLFPSLKAADELAYTQARQAVLCKEAPTSGKRYNSVAKLSLEKRKAASVSMWKVSILLTQSPLPHRASRMKKANTHRYNSIRPDNAMPRLTKLKTDDGKDKRATLQTNQCSSARDLFFFSLKFCWPLKNPVFGMHGMNITSKCLFIICRLSYSFISCWRIFLELIAL